MIRARLSRYCPLFHDWAYLEEAFRGYIGAVDGQGGATCRLLDHDGAKGRHCHRDGGSQGIVMPPSHLPQCAKESNGRKTVEGQEGRGSQSIFGCIPKCLRSDFSLDQELRRQIQWRVKADRICEHCFKAFQHGIRARRGPGVSHFIAIEGEGPLGLKDFGPNLRHVSIA